MAGLISWQALGRDACARPLRRLLATSSPAAQLGDRWRGPRLPFLSSGACPRPLAAGTELSSSGSSQCPGLYLIPGTPLRVLRRLLCLQKTRQVELAAPSMTIARLGHSCGYGYPEEASYPTGLEGGAIREGFLVEAAYEMNVKG